MTEMKACKEKFSRSRVQRQPNKGGGGIEKIWNQMMILLFIQDILDGQLKCFLVIGSFDNGLNLQGHLSLGHTRWYVTYQFIASYF